MNAFECPCRMSVGSELGSAKSILPVPTCINCLRAGKRSREETEVSATQCKRPLLLDAPTSSRVVPPDSGMSDSRVLSARDNVQIATVSQRTSADLSRSSEPSNIARMEWPLFRMKHDQFRELRPSVLFALLTHQHYHPCCHVLVAHLFVTLQ